MDSPYCGSLHNADRRPWSRIIYYCLLYNIVTSILWKSPYSELWTPKSHPNGLNQFPSIKPESWLILLVLRSYKIFAVHEDFIHFYPFFSNSRPLCTRSFRTRGILQLERVITIPGALSIIKGNSLLRTLQSGPAVSVIQRFHCITMLELKSNKHKLSCTVTWHAIPRQM